MYISWQVRSLLLTALWIAAAATSFVWADDNTTKAAFATCAQDAPLCTETDD